MLILIRSVGQGIQAGPDHRITVDRIRRNQFGQRHARLLVNGEPLVLYANMRHCLKNSPVIDICVFSFNRNSLRIGVAAPRSVRIVRLELLGDQPFDNSRAYRG